MLNADFIKSGEGPRLAFVPAAEAGALAETLVAFANTEGGIIVIGLQPNGRPAAKAEAADVDQMLKLAGDLYNPPVVIEKWEEIAVESADHASRGLAAYAVRVPRSTELHALSDGRVLIRSGSINRPLGGQEISRLASAKNTGDFESDAVPGASIDDFSRKMIDEYLEKRAERTKRPYSGKVNDLLIEIGAVTAEGKPTVCGLLLFSEYPQQ